MRCFHAPNSNVFALDILQCAVIGLHVSYVPARRPQGIMGVWPRGLRTTDDLRNHEPSRQIHVSKATFDESRGHQE